MGFLTPSLFSTAIELPGDPKSPAVQNENRTSRYVIYAKITASLPIGKEVWHSIRVKAKWPEYFGDL